MEILLKIEENSPNKRKVYLTIDIVPTLLLHFSYTYTYAKKKKNVVCSKLSRAIIYNAIAV